MKKVITIILICLFLIGIFVFIYYKYELPKKGLLEKNYKNISILAEYGGDPIRVGYLIETPMENLRGNTSNFYERVLVPNGGIYISNVNLKNQDFYENRRFFNITKENTRIDLVISRPQEVEFLVKENKTIEVEVYSKNFQEVDFCLVWSLNYLFVHTKYTQVQKIVGFENWGKCYNGTFSLLDNSQIINISYDTLGIPDESDYIRIVLIDKMGNNFDKRVK